MPPEAWLLTAISGLSAVIGVLFRLHLQADAEDRAQRDQALDGWKTQTDALKTLATALEKANVDRALRLRLADRDET